MWWTPELILQYFAFLAATIAAIFAAWRYWIADKSLRQDQISLRLEQFSKAAELLGKETSGGMGPSSITRVSSVVTLGRLARTYPKEFHVVVMGMFAAYLGAPTVYRVLGADKTVLRQVVAPDADSTREVIKFIEERTRMQKAIENYESYEFQLPMDAPFEIRADGKLYLTREKAIEVHTYLDEQGKSSVFLKERHPELPRPAWGKKGFLIS